MPFALAAAVLSFSLQGPVATPAAPRPRSAIWQQIAEAWDDLSAAQRDRALRNYQEYMELSPDKRRNIDQRYEKWKKLAPTDQERFRKKHNRFRGMGLLGD